MASSVSDVDALAALHFTSPDREVRNDAEARLRAVADDIGTMLHVAQDSQSPYSLMFVSMAMVTSFKAHRKELLGDMAVELLSRLYDCVERMAASLPQVVVSVGKTMIRSLCQIEKLVNEDAPGDGTVATRGIAVLSGRSAGSIAVALEVLTALATEFSLYDSGRSTTFMTFGAHRKASNRFREDTLLGLFQTAVGFLGRTDAGTPLPILDLACQLLRATLTYDFMAIIVDETEECSSAQVPSSWKDTVFSAELDAVWAAHLRLPLPLCTTLLTALGGLLGVRRSIFDTNEEKTRFLSFAMAQMNGILSCNDGRLNDPAYCNALAESFIRMLPPFAYRDLVQCEPNFSSWLHFAAQFSQKLFEIPFGAEGSFTTALLMLQFWGRLISSRRMHAGNHPEEKRLDLEPFTPSLARSFFQSRLSNAAGCANGSKGGNGGDPSDSDAVETIVPQAEAFASLVQLSPAEQLGEMGVFLRQSVGSGIVNAPDALVWLYYLTGSLVRVVLASADETSAAAFVPHLSFVTECVNSRVNVQSDDAVEQALVYFLQALQITFSSTRISPPQTKLIEAVFGDREKVFQFILTAVGHSMTGGARCSVPVLRQCISLIADASRDAPPAALRGMSFHLPPVAQLPMSQSLETYKLRTVLCAALFVMKLPEPWSAEEFRQFMVPTEELMNNTTYAGNELYVGGWLRDLRGITDSASQHEKTFTEYVDWVIDRSNVIMTLGQTPNLPPRVFISLLRFLSQLVTPTRGGRLSVPSACHCPTGVILFKFVAGVLQDVITNIMTPENMQRVQTMTNMPGGINAAFSDGAYLHMLKPLIIAMQTARKCITGEFCPFGAMAMYNDTSFDTLVAGLLGYTIAFPLEIFATYPKASQALADLLRSMCEAQVVSPFGCMRSDDLLMLVRLSLRFASEMDTRTPTLLGALQFLAFVSSLFPTVRKLQTTGPSQPVCLSPTRSQQRTTEKVASLLVGQTDMWAEIVDVAMCIVMTQDRGLSACSSVLFPLFDAEFSLWTSFAQQLLSSTAPAQQRGVEDALTELQSQITSQDKFFSGMFSFRSKYRTATLH